jgi:hypothetical protein
VIELMAQGLANVGIANRLVVCERTVEAPVRVTSSASWISRTATTALGESDALKVLGRRACGIPTRSRPFTQEPAVVDEQMLEIQGEVRERLNHRAQPCSVVPQPVNRTVHLNVLVDELIRLVDTVPVAAVDVAT